MTDLPSSATSTNGDVHALSIASSTTPSGTQHSKAFTSTKKPWSTCTLVAVLLSIVVAVGLLVGLLSGLLTRHSTSSSSTYRAVAVQYLPYSNSSNPSTILALNLQAYQGVVAAVAPQSPDLVVFPEGGTGYLIADNASTTNATLTRQALLPYCEIIPLLSTSPNPCQSLSSSTNPQLTTLSCLARQYSTSIVVNMCQVEPCVPGAPPVNLSYPFAMSACPADGFYFWSSNVVFSKEGVVLAVYAKAHLFDTLSFNTPQATTVTWTMDGITLGTMVAFDIEFTQPGRALLDAGVQHIVWTGWWETNQPPQLTSVMIQQAWAERWGINLIASNALTTVGYGGGVYSAGSIINTDFNPAFIPQPGNWHAVVQDLPRSLPTEPLPLTDPSPPVSSFVLPTITSSASVPCSISAITEGGNCTFLSQLPSQTVYAQHGDVTCVVSATTSNVSSALSNYALFASQNSFVEQDTPSYLFLESCFLLYCPSTAPNASPLPCDVLTYDSPVSFSSITVLASFNCSRFAATRADGGTGEEGQGPAGDVLPMLAVGQGVVVGGSGYEWGYVGKTVDGTGCWWNTTTVQGTSQGLFSMGFYGTDGQPIPSA